MKCYCDSHYLILYCRKSSETYQPAFNRRKSSDAHYLALNRRKSSDLF